MSEKEGGGYGGAERRNEGKRVSGNVRGKKRKNERKTGKMKERESKGKEEGNEREGKTLVSVRKFSESSESSGLNHEEPSGEP